MFTVCTVFISEGKYDETLAALGSSNRKFTPEMGVLFRRTFQCVTQPHILWYLTEWESEKHHNDAAQSLLKTRRDDRFASITFGPRPYLEVFCYEERGLRVGEFSDDLGFMVVAHGLINSKARESFLELREERTAEMRGRLPWLATYHNRYNPDEFVSFLGFTDEEEFNSVRSVGELLLEEYLFTGLRSPLGMSYLAGYNQFICAPFSFSEE